MHKDEKRIPGSGNERGEGDGEGVLAGLFCAFVCFSSSPLFLVFLSLFLLFFFPDVLPLFFSSSVRISLLSQFNSSWSPSVLSYFLPCVCLLLVVSSSVFPLSRCLFFSFLCHFPLVSPPGFPPRSFSLGSVSPLAFIARGRRHFLVTAGVHHGGVKHAPSPD